MRKTLKAWPAVRGIGECLVPGVGIEPTTLSSSGLRSTTELPRHYMYVKKYTDKSTCLAVFVNINRHFLYHYTQHSQHCQLALSLLRCRKLVILPLYSQNSYE